MVPNCSAAERDKGPPRALSKVLGEGAQRRRDRFLDLEIGVPLI